jgi:hypothetical protein
MAESEGPSFWTIRLESFGCAKFPDKVGARMLAESRLPLWTFINVSYRLTGYPNHLLLPRGEKTCRLRPRCITQAPLIAFNMCAVRYTDNESRLARVSIADDVADRAVARRSGPPVKDLSGNRFVDDPYRRRQPAARQIFRSASTWTKIAPRITQRMASILQHESAGQRPQATTLKLICTSVPGW